MLSHAEFNVNQKKRQTLCSSVMRWKNLIVQIPSKSNQKKTISKKVTEWRSKTRKCRKSNQLIEFNSKNSLFLLAVTHSCRCSTRVSYQFLNHDLKKNWWNYFAHEFITWIVTELNFTTNQIMFNIRSNCHRKKSPTQNDCRK